MRTINSNFPRVGLYPGFGHKTWHLWLSGSMFRIVLKFCSVFGMGKGTVFMNFFWKKLLRINRTFYSKFRLVIGISDLSVKYKGFSKILQGACEPHFYQIG